MENREALNKYTQPFKLGMLLAILEYNGALEPVTATNALLPLNSVQTLARFSSAISQMHSMGGRQEIEDLLLSIGDIPRELDAEQFQELVDGYKTECIFQSPYPGYLERKCKAYQPISSVR